MSRSDCFAIGGIVLGVISLIPAVPLFSSGNAALGALAVLLAVIILGFTLYFWLTSKLPPYTVLRHESHIEIADRTGRRASARKTLSLRPNHRGLQFYTHRNISTDGQGVTFTVDPGVTLVQQERHAGDHFVTIRFPTQLRRMSRAPLTWLEIICTDAFMADRESFTLLVDQPIKSVRVEVVLPQDRPPHPDSVRLVYRYSGSEEELERPEIITNRIAWERAHRYRCLRYGEYQLSWRW